MMRFSPEDIESTIFTLSVVGGAAILLLIIGLILFFAVGNDGGINTGVAPNYPYQGQ